LRLWAKQRDYWSEEKDKRRAKGFAGLTPAQEKGFQHWKDTGWERRLVLNTKTKQVWRNVDKAAKSTVAKDGLSIALKIIEDETINKYTVMLKAFGNDWKAIECMLVPRVLLTACGGTVPDHTAGSDESDDEDHDVEGAEEKCDDASDEENVLTVVPSIVKKSFQIHAILSYP